MANRGPDSRFVLEVNIKVLKPKSKRSLIIITQNHAYTKYEYQPGLKLPEYHHSYTNTVRVRTFFCLNTNCKADFWNTYVFEYYLRGTPHSTWYLTPNDTQFQSYFQIAIPVRVICWSLHNKGPFAILKKLLETCKLLLVSSRQKKFQCRTGLSSA